MWPSKHVPLREHPGFFALQFSPASSRFRLSGRKITLDANLSIVVWAINFWRENVT